MRLFNKVIDTAEEKGEDYFLKAIDFEMNRLIAEQENSDLAEILLYALKPTGKQLRPRIMFHLAQDFNLSMEHYLPFAVAVELVHIYSLVHDDLPCMDNARSRRNRCSVWVEFGEANALLAGNILLTYAFHYINQGLSSGASSSISHYFCRISGALGLLGGQYLDLKKTGLLASQDRINRMKTGALFSFCFYIPCVLSLMSSDKRERFVELGYDWGAFYQKMDDFEDGEFDGSLSPKEILEKLNNDFLIINKNIENLLVNDSSHIIVFLRDIFNKFMKRLGF